MAETINRYLPRAIVCLEEIAIGLNYLRKLDNKDTKSKSTYFYDSLKLIDEMDIRKQENINLNHRVKELETMLKGYQPRYE